MAQYEKMTIVAKPEETYTEGSYDYKYNFTDDGPMYYGKEKGTEKWEAKDVDSDAYLNIQSLFGHNSLDRKKYGEAKKILKGNDLNNLYNELKGDSASIDNAENEPIDDRLQYVEDIYNDQIVLGNEELEQVNTEATEFYDIPREIEEFEERTIMEYRGNTPVKTKVKVKTGKMIPNPDWVSVETKALEQVATEQKIPVNEVDLTDPKTAELLKQKIISVKTDELVDKKEQDKMELFIDSLPSDFNGKAFTAWITERLNITPGFGAVDAKHVWDKNIIQKDMEALNKNKAKKLGKESAAIGDFVDKAHTSLDLFSESFKAIQAGEYQTPAQVAAANKKLLQLNKQRNEVITLIKNQYAKLEDPERIDKVEDIEGYLGALERNYGVIPIMINNAENSGIDMAQGIEELAFQVANLPNVIEEEAGLDINKYNPLWNMGGKYLVNAWGESREGANKKIDEYKKALMGDVAENLSMDDIQSGNQWGRYLAQTVGAVAPQMATLVATGGAGVYLVTATAGGGRFRQYQSEMDANKKEIEAWKKLEPKKQEGETDEFHEDQLRIWNEKKPGEINYNAMEMWGGALVSMGSEFAGSKLIAMPMINRAKAFKGIGIKAGFTKEFGKKLLTGGYSYVGDLVSEGAEEVFAEGAGKLYDRMILGKDVNIFDGWKDNFFSGIVMANGFKTPALFSPYINAAQTPGDKSNILGKQKQIKDIVNTIVQNPKMSQKTKSLLEGDMVNLTADINNDLVNTMNRYNDMPRADIDALGNIEQQTYQLDQQVEAVKNDEGITIGKEALLEKLNNKKNELSGLKNELLEPFVVKDAEGRIIGGKNLVSPRARKLNEGASVVAEQLDSGIVSFENTEDFLGSVSSLEAQGGQIPNLNRNDKGEILPAKDQDYALVSKVPDADGNIVKQVIINEVSAAADNVDTSGLHEVGHLVLDKTFESNPEGGISMAQALINDVLETKDVSVDPSIINRFKQYNNDVQNGDITPKRYYEEVMTITSEGIANGQIKETPTLLTKLKTFGQNILNNFFSKSKANKIQFNNGKDVFEFLKDFNKSVESGKGLNEAQLKVAKEGAEGKLLDSNANAKDDSQGVKQSQKELSQDTKAYMEVDNDVLQQGLISEIKNEGDGQFSIAQAITEKNWPLISKSLDINSESQMNAAKEVVQEQLLGMFEGSGQGKYPARKTSALQGFSLDPEGGSPSAQVNTYLAKAFRSRKPEIDIAIKERTGSSTELNLDKATNIEDTSSNTNKIPQPKVKRSPKKDKRYNEVLSQNLGSEVAPAIDNAIKLDLENMNVGNRFGNTKNIGPKLGEVLGKTFKLDPRVFTDKSWNIKQGDLAGLTNLKQYLSSNAINDFKLLPDAYNSKGKSNFIPDNILNKLYTKDGKGKWKKDSTKTVADYKDLLGPIEGAVYRAAEATTVKGLAGLSFRNMMFETAVPNSLDRVDTGVKFSKKDIRNIAIDNGTNPVPAGKDGTTEMARVMTSPTGLRAGFGNLTDKIIVPGNYNPIGNTSERVIKNKGYFISDINKLVSKVEKGDADAKDLENTKKDLQDGKIGDLSVIIDIVKNTEGGKEFTKEDRIALAQAIKSQKRNNVLTNIKNKGLLNKGKDIFYDGIWNTVDADKNNIPVVLETIYPSNQKANASSGKNIANIINDAAKKEETGYDEHWMPYAAWAKYTGKTFKNKKARKNWSEHANNNYYQETISLDTQGVVDMSYDITLENGDIVKWLSKSELHPLYEKALNKAFETNSKADWKIADRLSDIRKYPGKTLKTVDGIKKLTPVHSFENGFVNPFTHGRYGESDALRYGMNVSPENQLNPNIQYEVASVIGEVVQGNITEKAAQERTKKYAPIAVLESKASKKITKDQGDKVNNDMTVQRQIDVLSTYDKAAAVGRDLNTETKGISVFDFDDTLAKTKEKVIVTMPDGSVNSISAADFAQQASQLEADGADFNFSNFENVGKGTKKGPLADLALKRQGKFGAKDIFVLTARPQIAAQGIKTFLDGIGLNLPLANITGLENGTPGAKGNWVAQKAAEGYNDFYFADDAYKNVEAVQEVLSQIDVKSVVQIAKASKKQTFDNVFNNILESSTGIESYKEYSSARAQTVGANKGKFSFFNTPSAEDFTGLLYKTLGKGKVGDAQMAFYKTNLLDPYNRAELSVTKAKIAAANDFKALKTNLKTLPKSLSKQTGIGGFTFSQASRVAAWTRQNMEVPGLSKRDVKELNDFVKNNAEMDVFVDELIKIQKGKPYPKPSDSWLGGTITSDILNEINKVNRKAYLQEWQENVDIIFSDKNMNKLEAAYGPNYVEALRDQLARMKSGSNRPIGGSRVVNNVLDWLNNSVGAVMFLNTRSAVLQTMSAINFINFGNNNIYKAGKAFANQKQFWGDFMTLMNSPYLTERRNGLKINVSESEIADAVAESSNKPKAAISYLLNKGFIMTRFADSFAIAVGGSSFYRNQIDAYVKDGMNKKDAEKKAFDDFYAVAETSQQSSNPSKISQQQASGAGRVILAFANTPMQYARIIKRSSQDLINKRGDWKTNVSKIVYYGAVQNLAFNALQNALFAVGFGEDEEEKDDNKTGRIANGMADSLLRGLGIQGAAVSALKNSLITIANENDKKSPKFVKAVYDLFDFSPPLDSKFRKLRSGANTITWERENIKNKGFNLNNPGYLAGSQIISGLTNLPLDRAVQKINNIRAIMSNSSQNWQKVAMAMGWSTWDVGLPYYGVNDKVEMTPQMILKEKVITMKKETSTKQQKETLLKLGLTKQQIKALKYEDARIKKILELQEKNLKK